MAEMIRLGTNICMPNAIQTRDDKFVILALKILLEGVAAPATRTIWNSSGLLQIGAVCTPSLHFWHKFDYTYTTLNRKNRLSG